MTLEEFSSEFDVLIQSYSKQLQFGDITDSIEFTEYEKSVFLTKAQEELVIELYNGKNPNRDSFEKTEEIRRYLSSLINTYESTTKEDNESTTKEDNIKGIDSSSVFFKIPSDLWFITYESATISSDTDNCINELVVPVIPVRQDEFHRIKKNPFRGSSKNRVLRLDANDNIVELISNYNITKYLVRYLSKPSPIIIENISSQGLEINNQSNKSECKLNTALHRLILDRAVRMALVSKSINVDNLDRK